MNAASGVSGGAFWFTLALVNAGLAEGKGRSRLAWFLLSLLLGPLATFLVVVLAPASAGADPSGPVSASIAPPADS
ncbi:hypothetical protein [Amnibacterium setariae]|uniref:Antitermination protein NusB n=1 Tax=Amnibacterium setariae TaxID=2306585 RepID=A0A3A1U6Q2_9MICO|nr:hypothetical protein [Amnibacterium setariae]RIX28604.1 hypothetical protein D1781_14435 [Amnibacterium setariae]